MTLGEGASLCQVCELLNLETLFPHFAGLVIERFERDDTEVRAHVRLRTPESLCPDCGEVSTSVHSRYERRIADAPVAGRPVVLVLLVRRFFCRAGACPRRTFAEQAECLAGPRRRRSTRLSLMLLSIALALAGRAGARLAAELAVVVSRMTMLRLIRAHGAPDFGTPDVLGVDDFALRRGHVYATVILNMRTHRPIDVLVGRDAETLASWLREHPGVEIICRDRAASYEDGSRQGAPDATQVADRFHLWQNLGEAVEKTVVAHRGCLREPAVVTDADQPDLLPSAIDRLDPEQQCLDVCGQERPLVARMRERYAAVQELRADGLSLNAISRRLDLAFRTVRRYALAADADELLVPTLNRDAKLDRFRPYIVRRWNSGCANATTLHHELQGLGWRGSLRTVNRYMARLRTLATPPSSDPVPPKPRRVTGWIMSDPDNLTSGSAVALKDILARCPELAAARRHVGTFASMIRNLGGNGLPAWVEQVRADDLPLLHRFAAGLQLDRQAVVAGLTLPWSNGPTEGAVNRIKYLKRQMYGRANLDLIRLRILNPN
ncbi:ISL3 family transposase [Embleya sp. NPDC059237]|uniref:ISL3 family transposase n=1 Tax=Embleya sp. NPDC059237 TaxID=3346784 RepID=UPI0036B8B4CB